MEKRYIINIADFNEGGAEPDRLYSQACSSEIDVRNLGVELSNEPENCSRKMAIQGMMYKAKDQFRSDIFEEDNPAVELTVKKREKEELKKLDKEAVNQLHHLNNVRLFYCSSWLELLKYIQLITKQQMERIKNLDRQNTKFHGVGVSEGISLPDPASIPRNLTKECPEAITDPLEQDNEPNNQEPVPGVNTSKKRRYGKYKGVPPVEIEDVLVDSPSVPFVPRLVNIPATDVVSVGRGSHEEAFQNGRKRMNFDICCCSIM